MVWIKPVTFADGSLVIDLVSDHLRWLVSTRNVRADELEGVRVTCDDEVSSLHGLRARRVCLKYRRLVSFGGDDGRRNACTTCWMRSSCGPDHRAF